MSSQENIEKVARYLANMSGTMWDQVNEEHQSVLQQYYYRHAYQILEMTQEKKKLGR